MGSAQELTVEMLAGSAILVVEDNPGAQTALRLALRRKGLEELTLVDTVRRAIATFNQDPERWCCAILDARVPDGSGLEVARHIAAENPTCGLVVLTARWDDAVVNEALGVPVHAFGHKPFDLDGPANLVLRAVAAARGLRLPCGRQAEPGYASVAAGLPSVLTAKQRYIVAMRLADRSYAEIGSTLEISVETVRSHLKHARKRMSAQPGEDLQTAVDRAAAEEFHTQTA